MFDQLFDDHSSVSSNTTLESNAIENESIHNNIIDDVDDDAPMNESASFDRSQYFFDRPNIDLDDIRVLHPHTDCTVHDAYLMVYTYYSRHGLTWTAMEDIIRLMNRIIGSEILKPPKYIF